MVAVVVTMMMWWEEERERERERICVEGEGRGETGIGEDQIRGKRGKAETVRNGEGIREKKRVKCASNEQ